MTRVTRHHQTRSWLVASLLPAIAAGCLETASASNDSGLSSASDLGNGEHGQIADATIADSSVPSDTFPALTDRMAPVDGANEVTSRDARPVEIVDGALLFPDGGGTGLRCEGQIGAERVAEEIHVWPETDAVGFQLCSDSRLLSRLTTRNCWSGRYSFPLADRDDSPDPLVFVLANGTVSARGEPLTDSVIVTVQGSGARCGLSPDCANRPVARVTCSGSARYLGQAGRPRSPPADAAVPSGITCRRGSEGAPESSWRVEPSVSAWVGRSGADWRLFLDSTALQDVTGERPSYLVGATSSSYSRIVSGIGPDPTGPVAANISGGELDETGATVSGTPTATVDLRVRSGGVIVACAGQDVLRRPF